MAADKGPPDRQDVPVTMEMGANQQDGNAGTMENEISATSAQAEGRGASPGTSSTSAPANSTLQNNLGARARVPAGGMDRSYAEASRTPAGRGAASSAHDDGDYERPQRTYEEQVRDATNNRNIIEINLTEVNGRDSATPLSEKDIAIIFFDYLKIKPDDATRIATRTSSFNMREIELKPHIAAGNHVNNGEHFIYNRDWRVLATAQSVRWTRVTFRDVPLNVEDEEIIHLCVLFGEVKNKNVMHEEASPNTRGVKKMTRYVDMRFNYGQYLNNFYWFEGPLEGDKAARVLVTHPQQPKQCSHCLQQPKIPPNTYGCEEGAIGSACRENGGRRADIEEYSQHLYAKHGYISMKRTHLFRDQQGPGGATRRNDGFVSQFDNQKKNPRKRTKKPRQPGQNNTQENQQGGSANPNAGTNMNLPANPSPIYNPPEIYLETGEPPVYQELALRTGLPAASLPPAPGSANQGTPASHQPPGSSQLPGGGAQGQDALNQTPTSPAPTQPGPETQAPGTTQPGPETPAPGAGTAQAGAVAPAPGAASPQPEMETQKGEGGTTPMEPPEHVNVEDAASGETPPNNPAGTHEASQLILTQPSPVNPPAARDDINPPVATIQPMAPAHSQDAVLPTTPSHWHEEMDGEQDRIPEHITSIFNTMEDSATQREQTEGLEQTPQHTPGTPLAAIRPYTHTPEEPALPQQTPPEDSLLSPSITNQDPNPRSLLQEPSQDHPHTPQIQPTPSQIQGTNGNLTVMSPSPTRPTNSQEHEDEDPYQLNVEQILIVAKEEPGEHTEDDDASTINDDSRSLRTTTGQDPLQEDMQATSQSLLAGEAETNGEEAAATQAPHAPFLTPDQKKRTTAADAFEQEFPPLEQRYDIAAEARDIPDDVWEWDADNETMNILDKVKWELLISRLCPSGGFNRQKSLARAIFREKIKQMKSGTRAGVRPRPSPDTESERQRSRREEPDPDQSL